MGDPDEGLTVEGHIRTGVRRERLQSVFAPVIEAAISRLALLDRERRSDLASLYIYGSVATGCAVVPDSDVDLLTVGIAHDATGQISRELSNRFVGICRGVEIAAASAADFEGDHDEAYGGRIFLQHYCLHLWGHKLLTSNTPFFGDAKAARAFNGDIAIHYRRWCTQLGKETPQQLGRSIARKSLLAVAGIVSMHDESWSTDRLSSALRWVQLHPDWQHACDRLASWSDGSSLASEDEISVMLAPGGPISAIVDDFESTIGLWQQ